MRRRFPLYARILLWFFLNLVLLGGVFLAVFHAQVRYGLDWLISGSASERLESVSNLIVAELSEVPEDKWGDILKRFNNAYHIQFGIFGRDGARLAGEGGPLPADVRERLLERRGSRFFDGPPTDGGPRRNGGGNAFMEGRHGPPPGPDNAPEAGAPGMQTSPRPKMMFRAGNPPRYWVFVRAVVSGPNRTRPVPVTLVAVSNSLSGEGLFVDVSVWIWLAVGVVVISALFWLPLVGSITRSISQMTAATRRIAEGHFDVRVDDRRRDELGDLGRSINQMAGRLAGFVTGQKRFLGDAAHELCSPLAKLRMALGILEERVGESHKQYVNTASEKAGQMASLVNELLSFSKASLGAEHVKLQPVSLVEMVEMAIHREQVEGVAINASVSSELVVQAEPELLVRSLANLLRNAIRYAGHAGPISVTACREAAGVVLRVEDGGPGVPEKELEQIFDPFYRLDASRDRATGGTGLGLAIVKTCIAACGGTVTAQNQPPPGGLAVIIRLPAADEK